MSTLESQTQIALNAIEDRPALQPCPVCSTKKFPNTPSYWPMQRTNRLTLLSCTAKCAFFDHANVPMVELKDHPEREAQKILAEWWNRRVEDHF